MAAAMLIPHLAHRRSTLQSNVDHISSGRSQCEIRLPMDPFGAMLSMQTMGNMDSAKSAAESEVKRLIDKLASEGKDRYPLDEVIAFLKTELDPQLCRAELRSIRKYFTDNRKFNEGGGSNTSRERRAAEKGVTLQEFSEAFMDFERPPGKIMVARSLDYQSSIDRQRFVKAIEATTDRNDALTTLPLTLLYIVVFMGLVVAHLDVLSRQEMEHSLESWVDGRDPLKACSSNCDDVASFWGWFLDKEDVGIAGIFAQYEDHSKNGTRTYYLANKNILVGDVNLECKRVLSDGSTTSDGMWLINSPQGQGHLAANHLDYKGAATAAATHFMTTLNAPSSSITEFRIKFSTINPGAWMYGYTKVSVKFTPYGSVKVVINTHALSIHPYNLESSWGIFVCLIDAVYTLLVAHLIFVELQDVIARARLGWTEFMEYWGFFNIIDWVNISAGVASIMIWLFLCIEMSSKTLHSALDELHDGNAIMSFDVGRLDDIITCIYGIVALYKAMHWMMAFNTVSIVLKFFKAFTSNPRLRVVTDTFKRAAEDFAHFGIIFVTIFLPFCIIGHVLFGNDVNEFSSIMSSLNTGLVVLMGDFEWYAELTASADYYSVLPSGMPVMVLFLWYVSYMFIVLLVLLNMLLAIIMLHYTSIVDDLKHKQDNPTLWKQVMGYMSMQKETWNFISMARLCRGLENDELPTSAPNDEVTFDYLCQELKNLGQDKEKLQRRQAMWLMRYCRKQLEFEHVPPDENDEESSTLEGLKELIEQHSDLMQEMLSAFRESKETQQRRMDNADSTTLAKIGRRLEELAENVAKVRRDQNGLAKRFEQLQSSILGARGQSPATPISPKLREAKEGTKDTRQDAPKDREHEDPSHDERGKPPQLQHAFSFDAPRRLPGVLEQGDQEEQASVTPAQHGHEVSTNQRGQEEKDMMQRMDSTGVEHQTSQQHRPGKKPEHRGDSGSVRHRVEQQRNVKANGAGAKLRDKDRLLKR